MQSFVPTFLIPMVVAMALSASSLGLAADHAFVLQPISASAVHHSVQRAPHMRNANGTSSNWSGYAVATDLGSPQSGAVTAVQGAWTVPAVTASTAAHTYSSIWVGIDGYSDGTVEQVGTEQDWANGSPVYYAWFEMYPRFAYKIVNFPVIPGDTMAAEVKYLGNRTYKLTITNVSQNVSYSIEQRSRIAQRQSAEWIVEAPFSGGVLPLADFGIINFFNCFTTLNGDTGSISDSMWQNDPITMATSGGPVKAQPSGLSPDGTSFSVTWSHE